MADHFFGIVTHDYGGSSPNSGPFLCPKNGTVPLYKKNPKDIYFRELPMVFCRGCSITPQLAWIVRLAAGCLQKHILKVPLGSGSYSRSAHSNSRRCPILCSAASPCKLSSHNPRGGTQSAATPKSEALPEYTIILCYTIPHYTILYTILCLYFKTRCFTMK